MPRSLPKKLRKEISIPARELVREHRAQFSTEPNLRKRAGSFLTGLLPPKPRRRGRPGTASEAVLTEARNTLSQANRIPAIARRTSHGLEGTLKVGFSSAAAHTILPRVVRSLRSKVPEVKLQLYEMSTERVEPGGKAGFMGQQSLRVKISLDISLILPYPQSTKPTGI
jgi:hypothetical protein